MKHMMKGRNAKAALLSASVLALFLASLAAVPEIAAAGSSSTTSNTSSAALNSVSLTIQPKGSTPDSSFDLVAYNATGSPVASYTGQYPRVTFDLPGGSYLFVATEVTQQSYATPVCCICAGTAASGAPSSTQTSASSAGADIAIPCCCGGGEQAVQYGYSLNQVSGSTSISIATLPSSAIPTTSITVGVSFKNGTAAAGAYVSAEAVGQDYYWDSNSTLTMSDQTGTNGVAHLVVPDVPLTVSASTSVQVYLPKNQTSIPVNVGGQTVNVTVYYSPEYVYLSASALLIPPQTSLSMVLAAETNQFYPPIAYASGTSASSGSSAPQGTAAPTNSGASGSTSSASTASQSTSPQLLTIPPIPVSLLASMSSSQASASGGFSQSTLTELGILAFAVAAAALAGLAISKRRA